MHHPAPVRGPQTAVDLLVGPGVATRPLPSAAARAFRAGLRAFARDDFRVAMRQWREAVRQAPDHPECHAALGLAASHGGEPLAAAEALRTATALAPGSVTLWRLRADTALLQGANSEAFEALRELVRLAPDDAEALGNLGALYREAGEPVAALQALHRALALNPADARALSNTALTLHDLGQFAMARDAASAALALDPSRADARWNLALMELLHGDFTRGWASHEQRAPVRRLEQTTRHYAVPRWDGAPLTGALLLWPEQGLGDFLQFVRFVPDVVQRAGPAARVVLATPTPLRALVRAALPDSIEVIDADDAPPPIAAHAPLLSLPFLLDLGASLRAERVPYLHRTGTPPAVLDTLLPEAQAEPLRVGFVWAGQPRHLNDRNRSTTLETLEPLMDIPGIQPFSLQKGAGEDRIPAFNALRQSAGKSPLIALGHTFESFADTAHAISRLDLVITVDTAVAHLAGAMGCAVWLLIPFVPDWRWQIGRSDSPWYGSVRLFRQTARGDWSAVITAAAQALAARTPRARQAA